MSQNNENTQASKLVLVSQDTELVNLAKGAIPNTDQQTMHIISKPIAEVVNGMRDIDGSAMIIDIDATKVEDFENLQKIKRLADNNMAIIVISSNFSPAAARILIQLKVSDFLVKPVQTSDLVRSCNNAMKINTQESQVQPQFMSFMPASGGVGTTAMAIETAAILNAHGLKTGRTTCIVDLNFQHGACAEYLDIELTGSDKLFVVADMTVPSIRHSHRLVKAVEERIGKQANPKIIVNRMDFRKNASGLNAGDVENALGEYFAGGIPNNYMLVRDAVDRGVTLSSVQSDNNVTQALSGIVLAGEVQDEAQTTKKSGLMSLGRNLLKRKAG